MSGGGARDHWHRSPVVAIVLLSLAFMGLRVLAWWVVQHLQGASRFTLAAIAIGSLALYMLIVVLLIFSVARLRIAAAGQAALVVCFGAALCAARAARVPVGGDLALVLAAAFLGVLVARLIREPNMLVPVALVASIVDMWGVYYGVVREIGERAPETAAALSTSVPMAVAPMLGSIGIGDFVFMGLFFAAVVRLGLCVSATLWASAAALLIASLVFFGASLSPHLAPLAQRLPGLPFLAAAVVAVNARRFDFSREENRAVVAVVVALGLILTAVTLVWRTGT